MVIIKSATLDNLPAITEIYNEAVLTTTATFDTKPKSVVERQTWFEEHKPPYSVVVAQMDNVVVGWTSLSRWSPKLAYAGAIEISLYVGSAYRGKGIGKQLMTTILMEGQKNGFHTVLARITEGNKASVRLHEAFGFELVGVIREVGYKFNRWLDVYLMQKIYYRKTTTSGSGPKKGSTSVLNMTGIMYQPRRCEANRRYIMTRQFKKLAHSLYECKYHVVFCPKYRYKIMQDEVAKYVTQQIYRLSSQKDGIEVLEVNVQKDHVHLVVTIPPKYAVSKYMGFLKGKLALQLFDRFPQLRKRYWGQHVWSRGYCVSTVGLDEERIKKYVKWQNRKDEDSDATQGKLFD